MEWSMQGLANQKARWLAVVLTLIFATVPAQGSMLPYYSSEDFSPQWHNPKPHQLKFKELVNQLGQKKQPRDWLGQVTVVNFFFTGCPGLCDLLMKRMAELEQRLPLGTHLVSISVDPTSDTPQVLSTFGKKYQNGRLNWSLYTGDAEEIQRMARRFFFAKNTSVDVEALLHNESFYLLDRSLNLRGVYNGTLPRSVKEIAEDVSMLRR